jgi:hypothetical protein
MPHQHQRMLSSEIDAACCIVNLNLQRRSAFEGSHFGRIIRLLVVFIGIGTVAIMSGINPPMVMFVLMVAAFVTTRMGDRVLAEIDGETLPDRWLVRRWHALRGKTHA